MQILYDFKISMTKYIKLGIENHFPAFEVCPGCKAKVKLKRHGFYWRYIHLIKKAVKVPVCRYFCPSCCKTISLLPIFLLPYYQLPLRVIMKLIQCAASGKQVLLNLKRQHLQFIKKRFMNNLNWIEAFFRDKGYGGYIMQDKKEKAMKLMDLINTAATVETFSQRFHNHFLRAFMAQPNAN